jgi:hypothetical protein
MWRHPTGTYVIEREREAGAVAPRGRCCPGARYELTAFATESSFEGRPSATALVHERCGFHLFHRGYVAVELLPKKSSAQQSSHSE